MKKIYVLALGFMAAIGASAQNDTLVWDNFNGESWTEISETELQTEVGNFIVFELSPGTVGDEKWYNIDMDGNTDANDRPGEWFRALALTEADSSVFDGTMGSSSWFNPFAQANNWLITNSFYCSGDAVLSWYSAPRQTPLFVDGYKVKVSVLSNDPSDFTTTIFTAKEFASRTAGDSCVYANYTFAPAGAGFVHGQDGTFTSPENDNDCSRLWGSLRQQTVSLSQFAGKRIYVAFVHDSDDDNLITLDNVLVKGTRVDDASIEENNKFSFSAYPNPATDRINIGYQLDQSSTVIVKVLDNTGRVIKLVNLGTQSGNNSASIDVADLAAGIYTVSMETGNAKTSKKFIKR